MYILTLVTSVLTLWSVVRSVQINKGNDTAATTGVPRGKITTITVLLLVASLVIGTVCGLGETDFTAADGTVTSAAWVTVVDAFCISIGILMVAAAAAVAVSMSGVLTKSASK